MTNEGTLRSPRLVRSVFVFAVVTAAALSAVATPAPAASRKAPASAAGDPAVGDAKLANTKLGDAIAAIDADPKDAVRRLHDLADELSYLDDVLDYYAALARSRESTSGGRREFEDFVDDHPGSILFADATAELARLLEASKDEDRLVALADRHGRNAPDSSAASSVCLSAGRLLAGEKDAAKAYAYLQCARTKSPLSNAAREAYDLVVQLRARHPALAPAGAAGLMAEARLLAREGRTAEQVAVLRELLAKYAGSDVEREAELAYGRSLGRSQGKADGADFFEKRAAAAAGTRKAKLLYEAATLRWNDDRNKEAAALFERMLALKTGIGDEQQAWYALGRINDAEGHRADAIRFYGKAAATAPRGTARAESQWRQGWVSYRAKDFTTAEDAFAKMAESAPRGSDTDGRADALYWQGRSLERLGRKDDARRLYLAVLSEFPLGYYAAAAENRLGRRGTATTPARGLDAPKSLPAPAALAVARAPTLREAGLVTLAERDLAARLEGFDAATRRAVLPVLPASGAYDAAFRIAIEMNRKGELTNEESRTYFYPLAHADLVEREARAAGIEPMFVYALMRQESAFDATAVSSAKALGLMQLLESTARRVAASSGLPEPSAEDLFDPAVNIRLGVRYLAQLSKQFDGNTALMAASYNAGETAAEKWRGLASAWDEDEMIEQISYRETRGYVKSILRNMRNYRSIYGEKS